jgi:heterodisulfide reductase subunit D
VENKKDREEMGLDYYEDIIHRCFRCGYCKFTHDYIDYNCPSYKKYRFESFSTGGRLWLIHALRTGEISWSPRLLEILYACTTCGNCAENCRFDKFKEAFVDIIEMARSEAFKSENAPENWVSVGEHVVSEHNPYYEKHQDRISWVPEDFSNPNDADVAFFAGCTSSYREKQMAQNTFEVLSKINVKFAVFADEWCCGSPLFRTGLRDIGLELVNHNIGLFKKSNIQKVITACAGCYRTIKYDYPKIIGVELPFKVYHISEYVAELIKEGKLKLKTPIKKKVTYHDPCHLGRHSNLYDEPREVIKAIPGIELIEMRKIKQDASCCGAGGGVKAGYPEWSLEMASNRVKEALELGVDALVTSCPFCERNFSDAIKSNNFKIELLDLVDLVNQSLKS